MAQRPCCQVMLLALESGKVAKVAIREECGKQVRLGVVFLSIEIQFCPWCGANVERWLERVQR